jgi:hypothetical protein
MPDVLKFSKESRRPFLIELPKPVDIQEVIEKL